jgi:hypothetical protein
MKKSRQRSSRREYMQDLNEKEQKKEQQAGIYAEFNS